jgi:hypothetical protein
MPAPMPLLPPNISTRRLAMASAAKPVALFMPASGN